MPKAGTTKHVIIDPKLLRWAQAVATEFQIDYADLEDDENAEEEEEVQAAAKPPALTPYKLEAEALQEVQRALARRQHALVALVNTIEPQVVSTRMQWPTLLEGHGALSKTYQDLDKEASALASQDPVESVVAALESQVQTFKQRLDDLAALFKAYPQGDDLVSWADAHRDTPSCLGILVLMAAALAKTPPDTGAYETACNDLDQLRMEWSSEEALAEEFTTTLDDLHGLAAELGGNNGRYVDAIRTARAAVATALRDKAVKARKSLLTKAVNQCKEVFVATRLRTQATVKLDSEKLLLGAEAALVKIKDLLIAGMKNLKQRKNRLAELTVRCDQSLRIADIGRKTIQTLAQETTDLIGDITEFGHSLTDKPSSAKAIAGESKTTLATITEAEADKLPSKQRGQMLVQAVREARKESSWMDASIRFIAGELADGRPDHVHLAGGGHTLLNNGRILLGFMTSHLDSSQPSKRKAAPIFGRELGTNVVDVAVVNGELCEVLPQD